MKLLLCGLDTVECAYYLRAGASCGIDFDALRAQREIMRSAKQPESGVLELGGMEFMMSANGTKSGYPLQLPEERAIHPM